MHGKPRGFGCSTLSAQPALAGTDVYGFDVARQREDGRSEAQARSEAEGGVSGCPLGGERHNERLILRTKSDGTTINLLYDADGHRIAKHIFNAAAQPVSSTAWLVDTNNLTGYAQVFEERVSVGGSTPSSTVRTYTYGTDLISQAISLNSQPSTLHYYAYDGHGSTRELTDATGNVTDRYDYDAFGNLTFSSGTTANMYRYAGEQYDPDLGLYYLRARYLNTDSGRFWSMDGYEGASDDPASLHKYLYANADPVGHIDPSGHYSMVQLQMAVVSVGTLARIAWPSVARTFQSVSRFLYNNQSFRAISQRYWSQLGPANGRSLHHWLIPQRWTWVPQGIRNAGFNLLELPAVISFPGGLNSWMGFAVRWGGYRMVIAVIVENGIRVAIPLSLYGAWEAGGAIGAAAANNAPDGISPATLTTDEETELRDLRAMMQEP